MRDPSVSEALVGPFQLLDKGLSPSYEKLGDLVHQCKEFGAGRYLVEGGIGERFAIVLYDDMSWRISTTQLELFPTKSAHTLT